jgi:hypothetical protein
MNNSENGLNIVAREYELLKGGFEGVSG